MAESAVDFLLEKFSSLLEEEVKLLGGVRKEVVSVKDELESMRAFLRVADAIEDEEIKVWVKQVREVAYDTEDILDEFLYRFEENRRQGFYGYLCKMARTIKNLKSRHRIASEMQSIKSRVTKISERHQRYRYKSNIIEQVSSSSNAANKAWYERRNDARLLQETQLIGIDNPKEKLVRLLLEDAASSVRVVAVVGMGGLGKTTLVNQVYNDSQVKERFQHSAWITVSQSPNPCDLLREIIENLFGGIKEPIPQEASSSRRYDLTKILLDFLSERRYLVVMDDVWEKDAWNNLKFAFPENSQGSRIMVTTRNIDVASTTTRDFYEGNIYHLKSLSSAESWSLFCARTFQGKSCPQHLVEISQNILRRCMGLPLAIVTISGVLATKDTSKVNEWEMVGRSLGTEFDEEVKNMRKILLLGLNDLPYYLKYCFMYLSMFPEDWIYSRNTITELWVAEGFVQEIETSSPEEVADAYFDELLNRSLIQLIVDRPNKIMSVFKVHDLLLELILSLSKTQNFARMADNANPRLPEKMRRLSIRSTYENFQGHHDFSRLRTLKILHSKGSTPRISISEFLKDGLRLLRVLDCYELPLDSFPECITKMYTLKHLNLNGTKVASIPRSIWRLRNLENLDLGETFVEELPVEILQLHRLHHIRVYHSIDDHGSSLMKRIGCKVPTRIGTLTSLRTLYLIRASQGRPIDLITSLENLKQLRKLGIQELRAEHGPALCSLIAKLSHLQLLDMETIGEDEILDVQDVSTPPQYLQQLFMYGRLEMLPHWVSKHSSLLTLSLGWSKLQVDPLESLQALPNLATLEFHKAYDGEALCFKAGGFQMLKRFECYSLGRLRRVIVEEGTMPRLQELKLEDCKLLEEVPPGLAFLSNLKKIYFINMGDQLVTRLSSSNQDSNFLRVKHVPSVYIGSYDAGGFHGDFVNT